MTEILDLTPAMDLDTELTNGMDNNDDRHPMENEPPLPQDDSPPRNSHLTNCEQMKILARNIKYYTITIENIKANIGSLKLHGLNDEDCHIMKEHLQRLDNYTALNALTANSNCVIFGDFNAIHSAWNCSKNSPRGIRLKYFTDDNNLEIAFPNSPTRYGYNSSNTLDFAIISNFNYPYNIVSINDLSSDHNPVMLNFNIATPIHKDNPRAITTCCSAFRKNLKNEIKLFDYAKINSESTLEEKVAKFADAVSSAHNLASKPIKNTRHSYTPQHINYLITCKNRARKLYQQTLNPLHKTEANRLQKLIKKEIRIHAQNTWNAKLESLETQDNSLWRMQKYFRKKRSDIPNLTGPNGIASNDEQKANLIANTDNYTGHRQLHGK
ncbi:RNA-directed DNA polymerase from mobile element jockey [Trichonephila clavipes]|uniref:RNA-directed DNA polymerase from mobile element jockey n=1 Tax=Trichonephila clavipes TaxID=2585209 RepID=A0A8X6RIX6_TRICX|nr:RNA-directed DNA polymerase from mobile element jockey [Trichonephila clavipes]